MVNTLMKSIQSLPLARDFRVLTAVFQDEAAKMVTLRDISSDNWKCDGESFSIVYPNLQQKKFHFWLLTSCCELGELCNKLNKHLMVY